MSTAARGLLQPWGSGRELRGSAEAAAGGAGGPWFLGGALYCPGRLTLMKVIPALTGLRPVSESPPS